MTTNLTALDIKTLVLMPLSLMTLNLTAIIIKTISNMTHGLSIIHNLS